LGLKNALVDLRRDDAFVLEGEAVGNASTWEAACTQTAHWFNPNKHRYGLYDAQPGVVAAVRDGAPFPTPWLTRLAGSDRPDLDRGARALWPAWQSVPCRDDARATTLASWDLEDAVTGLPPGAWPATGTLARLQMWTLALRTATVEDAAALAERVAVTRSRTEGLLVHPHMEGWTVAASPWTLAQESSRP
jgi:hypothetical protein